jgi:hypothetical protein
LVSNGVNGYGFNDGFHYDDEHEPDWGKHETGVQYDHSLQGTDAHVKLAKLINQCNEIANGTASNENIMYLWGDDFAFTNAYATF